jgi:small GTP-binding protein
MEINNEGIKIVFIGESGVGKTSIIKRFIDNSFEANMEPSFGGSFLAKSLLFNDGEKLRFDIWDTAGQERYRSLTQMFYQDAKIAILVYDITRYNSYDELTKFWFKKVKENTRSDTILVLVANKSDLVEQEEVNEDDAKKFAKEKNINFFSVSAKNDYGIKEMFTQIAKTYTGRDDFRFIGKGEELNIQEGIKDSNNSEKKIIGKSRSVKLKASNDNNNIKQKCC